MCSELALYGVIGYVKGLYKGIRYVTSKKRDVEITFGYLHSSMLQTAIFSHTWWVTVAMKYLKQCEKSSFSEDFSKLVSYSNHIKLLSKYDFLFLSFQLCFASTVKPKHFGLILIALRVMPSLL